MPLRPLPGKSFPDLVLAIIIAVGDVCLVPSYACPQFSDAPPDVISTDQGLSESTIRAIIQDSQGFMWFGTDDGLNRYDGYSVTVYQHNVADSNSISDDFIWSVCADSDGALWIGTQRGGLNRYDPVRDRFTHYTRAKDNPESIGSDNVPVVFRDHRNVLWCGTWGGGLCRFDRERKCFVRYVHHPGEPNSLAGDFVGAIAEDRSGVLWVGTRTGVSALDSQRTRFTTYAHDGRAPQSLSGNEVRSIYEDRVGVLWVGTQEGGLNRFDPVQRQFGQCLRNPPAAGNPGADVALHFFEDRLHNLWICTFGGGLIRYDRAQDRFVRFVSGPLRPRSEYGDIVTFGYKDRIGGIWLGVEVGVIHYDPDRHVFRHIRVDPNHKRGLSNSSVRGICEDREGYLWVATRGGLDRMDPQGKNVRHFLHDPANPFSLGSNALLAVCEDHTGDLWIATSRTGLDRYNRRQNRFFHYRHDDANPRTLSGNDIACVMEDREGDLWIGANNSSLCKYVRTKRTFIRYPYDPGNPASLRARYVWALHEDRAGNVWIGTWGDGVSRYDRGQDRFIRYIPDPQDPHSLSNNTVSAICEDEQGKLWMGTLGGGVNRYDPSTDQFDRYDVNDGLPNNSVYGVLSDGHGGIWVSTNRGVARLDPATRTCKAYTVADGLLSNEFNGGASFRCRSGEMYFGGVNGLDAFHPDSIHDNENLPPVVITQFRVFDRPVGLDTAITRIKTIVLPYDQNFFSFEFVALSYTAPVKNQYAYRLEGLEQAWTRAGTRRYASYTHLDPGTYMFHVKASNNDGRWNEEGAMVAVRIVPPFWRTGWFALAAITAAALAGISLYRYRVNQLVEIERLRMRIASDLHDELASNLSSIAMFSDIIHDETKETARISSTHRQLLRRIIALSSESVSSIRDIIWAIDPNPESMADLLVRLRDSAIPACRGRNIRLVFPDPDRHSLPSVNLSPEQRKNLWLLLKEALANAVEHSGCAELRVHWQFTVGKLAMEVTDDGAGFDPAVKSKGRGRGTMEARAQQLGAVFALRSSPGRGTTVSLSFKL